MWSLQTVTIPTQRCGAVGILALQRGEDVNPGASGDLTANRFELWPLYPYMDLSVDADRLRANLEANAEFGRIASDDPEERGRTNRTGTEANGQARDRLVDRFDDAGLDVAVDAVGNLVGTWTPTRPTPTRRPSRAAATLTASPRAGSSTAPGVYAALEAVRAMQDAGVEPARPVAVVSFHRGGGRDVRERAARVERRDRSDRPRRGARARKRRGRDAGRGARPDRLPRRRRDRSGVMGGVLRDAHRAGHGLEDVGADAGVVTTITGITHCEATIEGEANHAGATAMEDRTDALAAASEFVLDVEGGRERCRRDRQRLRGRDGGIAVRLAERDQRRPRSRRGRRRRARRRDRIDGDHCRRRARVARRLERERGVETAFERPFSVTPTPMSDRFLDAAHAAAEAAGLTAVDLHSGAAHDAMRVAAVADSAPLFAPSQDGISHSPREWTDWADCAAATEVLAGALARVADE